MGDEWNVHGICISIDKVVTSCTNNDNTFTKFTDLTRWYVLISFGLRFAHADFPFHADMNKTCIEFLVGLNVTRKLIKKIILEIVHPTTLQIYLQDGI